MRDGPIIALDAMGGDNAPGEIVAGAVEAARDLGVRVALVGGPDAMAACLARDGPRAVMAAAIMYLGRIKGIERPTLAGLMPLSGKLTVFLDVGANADCKPAYLLQFAEMASAYMERVWKVERPRVALLNIGEEETKGSALAQEAYALLAKSGLNFIGNVEGRHGPTEVG